MLTGIESRSIPRSLVCASGDTTFYTTPGNKIGSIVQMTIDTAYASGQFGTIQINLRDTFGPLGGTSGTVQRYQTQVLAGDVVVIPDIVGIEFFGRLEVRTNLSGPVVSLGAILR